DVKSVSFCGSNFPGQYNRSEGYGKGICYQNRCNARRGSYFRCNLEMGSWDFCSQRPNLNYMGETCGNENSIMRLILFSQKHFEGNQSVMKTFERTRCVNTMTWDDNLNLTDRKLIGSIDIKWHCLPNGSLGDECKSTCEPRGESHFWCQVGSLSHEVDFCLPRPHQDYFGNYCEGNCSTTDPWTIIHLNPSSLGSSLKNSLSLTITVLIQLLRFIV
ncbi:unnamed protein product, partial [Allacma fusca]